MKYLKTEYSRLTCLGTVVHLRNIVEDRYGIKKDRKRFVVGFVVGLVISFSFFSCDKRPGCGRLYQEGVKNGAKYTDSLTYCKGS